ncbi:MAG: thioredoxin family protein [Thermoguttaceae bacterium]
MTLTLCAALMQTVLLASPTDSNETYTEARRQITETGRPMVVMVSTDWCGPCQSMKRNVLPRLRERGMFKKVAFAQVNADRDSELAKELTGGGPIPQLVMYRRSGRGWVRAKLVGGQSVEKVEQFINEELASDKANQDSDKSGVDKDSESTDSAAELPEVPAKSSHT